MSDELEKLLQKVHPGITVFDFDGKPVPCIILEEKKYDESIIKHQRKRKHLRCKLVLMRKIILIVLAEQHEQVKRV